MDLSQLRPTKEGKKKTPKRIGRGGKYRKTAGKGESGQKKRSHRTIRPEARFAIKQIPKRRGYGVNRGKTVYTDRPRPEVLNVSTLEANLESGAEVTPKNLFESGIIKKKSGRLPSVKILGDGEVKKKFSISKCAVSSSAKEKIEKAGGEVK